MRALEVLGLAEDGTNLVCQDPATGEEFTLPANERLTAAARGDVSRLGQLEIELESQLRPKEIQARIRAGATVAEVASAAGTSAQRIERFAYPVLMERSTMAEQSGRARPVGPAGPAAVSIKDVVAETLRSRGHTGPVEWDAFKDSQGWLLAVRWRVGRSENTALFALHPGPGGGTVTPRDDVATDLLDPAPKPLRTVRPVDTLTLADTQRIPRVHDGPQSESPAPATGRASTPERTGTPRTETDDRVFETADDAQPDDEQLVADTVDDDRAGVRPASRVDEQIARTGTDHASARSAKKHSRSTKPAMPSWDDVLLGGGIKPR